jgi:hypothetical protein
MASEMHLTFDKNLKKINYRLLFQHFVIKLFGIFLQNSRIDQFLAKIQLKIILVFSDWPIALPKAMKGDCFPKYCAEIWRSEFISWTVV